MPYMTPEEIQRLSNNKITAIPPCVETLQGRATEVVPNEKVTHIFPVQEQFCNVVGSMQGGFITAAFDNVFGHLGYLISGDQQIASLDISTSFHRPIFPGDELRITVHLRYRGKMAAYMEGQAVNKQDKLIASAQTHIVFIPS